MTQRSDLSPSLKAQKSLDSPSDYFSTICESPRPKIAAIPIIYKKVQNDKRMRARLRVSGYKYFGKLSACGEDTNLTLENILKSRSVKCIRKFEFDPYLCEKSYMKPFSQALKKFNDLEGLNFVIRRLDYTNESNILTPFMVRLTKMKKMRFEITRVGNLDDNGLKKFAWTFGKLYSVREFEQVQIGMDHLSQLANMYFKKYGNNLKFCTKFKKVWQKASFLSKHECAIKNIQANFVRKMKYLPNLKDMSFHLSMPQGWLSMSTEVDESTFLNLRLMTAQKYLERLHLQFSGNPVTLETIQGLSESLPTLIYLRDFGLEFLNSRVSETEVVLLAQVLPQVKSLERFSFKVLQYPNVSEGCIFYLMSVISKLPNIKHFEIYFRRMDTSSGLVQEVFERIKSFNNIQCSYSKQSLTFSRIEQSSEF